MDIATYLRDQKEWLGKQTRQVKDFSVFDFNYVPVQPVPRTECKELINAMLQFDLSSVPTHLAVIGSRGSGKTMTLKFLQRVIPPQTDLEMIHINCREHNTSFKIFAALVGGKKGGQNLMQHYDRFLARYRKRTVIVLDEVDLMSPKDKRREILYLLSRSPQPYMVIMLSNNPQILQQLDAATRSSLQPLPVHFKNYDAGQIRDILQDRARAGLHRWEEATLAEIAALTTRMTNSDARVAIKTLLYTLIRSPGDVRTCFEQARRDVVIDMVHDLSDATLLILWAAATSSSDLVKDIYRRYSRSSRNYQEKPFSYVHFYATLSYLQSAGLIALVSTKVDRTYTNRVLLTCEPSIVHSICQLRFEGI